MTMSEILKGLYVPKRGEPFFPYLIPNAKLRQIDSSKLSSVMLNGTERNQLMVPSTGDVSLLIRYKERDGAISSLTLSKFDLRIDQLQGAKQEGYRVTSSMRWVHFFADEILEIARDGESGVERLVMSPAFAIQGLLDATEGAMVRYQEFAARLGMRFSVEEMLLVRDVES